MNTKKCFMVILTILAGTLSFSCSNNGDDPVMPKTETDTSTDTPSDKTEKELDNNLRLTQSQLDRVQDANAFSLSLLQKLDESNEEAASLIVSPLSLVYALGMTSEGASGETLNEITKTLGFAEGDVKGIRSLCSKFMSRIPGVDSKVKLSVANGVFCNKGRNLEIPFVNLLKENYEAQVATLDFSDPASVGSINAWCSDKTEGKIKGFIDNLDPSTLLFVANALYFKASWTQPFYSYMTALQPFMREKAPAVDVPMMMHEKVKIPYASCELFQMCEMPYGDGKFSMQFVLPQSDLTLRQLLRMLTWDKLLYTARDLSDKYNTTLMLPRFTTEADLNLVETLKSLGIKRAFTTSAELDGIASSTYISSMKQKTVINVNEEGTEAASVSGTSHGSYGIETLNTFIANHPFMYLIKENSTGVVLFIGTYNGD